MIQSTTLMDKTKNKQKYAQSGSNPKQF